MSRGELDQVTLEQVDSKLHNLAALSTRVLSLTPDFVSMAFEPASSIPVAAPCLHDSLHVVAEARYALFEAFAHLAWYREKRKTPNEQTAVWFARFYTTAAASCLYAAAEDLAKAIIEMFEIDLQKFGLKAGKGTSLHSRVGAYLLKEMPNKGISGAVIALGQSDAWARTMNWRNNWVHDQTLVQGLGIVYSRGKRWRTFEEADGTHGDILHFAGGDMPDHTIDDVLEFVVAAFEGFLGAFNEVVTCYLNILSKAGITLEDTGPASSVARLPSDSYTAQLPTSNVGITTHATATYLPNPKAERDGIGLCLSGGGYRAALFHLGALRRLNELGILTKLKTISSVSGGSIISAHLATRLPRPLTGPTLDWESQVAAPFRRFTTMNIRTPALVAAFLPWKTGAQALAGQYKKHLTNLKLANLPEAPRFVICATDLAFGVNWVFQKARIGDYEAGHEPPPPGLPLALAVAASSCFPPVFKPLRMHLDPNKLAGGKVPQGSERDNCIHGLALSDGGVYDNLGLEPVWKDHAVVLSSDGGALFGIGSDTSLIWEVKRYVGIPENQALAVRKRWLMANFISGVMEGTYWGIGGATSSYDIDGGYSKELASGVIAAIRTDLDSFSHAEAAVLENHGYLLADAAVKRHVPVLLPVIIPTLTVPHPDWMDEGRVKAALKDSGHRSLLGR